jgi:hypothetical protein
MVTHLWVFSGKGHADADIFCYHLKTETSDVGVLFAGSFHTQVKYLLPMDFTKYQNDSPF